MMCVGVARYEGVHDQSRSARRATQCKVHPQGLRQCEYVVSSANGETLKIRLHFVSYQNGKPLTMLDTLTEDLNSR